MLYNKSTETQEAWILFYEGQFIEEQYLEIPPQALLTVDIRAWHPNPNRPDWAVLTKNSELELPTGWRRDKGSFFEITLNNPEEIQILNLFPQEQEIRLVYQNEKGQALETEIRTSPQYLKSENWQLSPPAGSQRLQIKAQANIMLQSKGQVQIQRDESRKPITNRVHFLVSGEDGSSFVAPIEDSKLITKAREEMKNPQGFMIFADLDLNNDEPNRNLVSKNREYWSWKIKRVTGLSQVGADWCFAYPEYIERMLHIWMNKKRACFRGQKIIRELTPTEVETGHLSN